MEGALGIQVSESLIHHGNRSGPCGVAHYSSGARKKIYDLLSEHASHASYPGFSLVMNAQNLGEIGPFFDEKKLGVWLSIEPHK
jgi:hypothetical protein